MPTGGATSMCKWQEAVGRHAAFKQCGMRDMELCGKCVQPHIISNVATAADEGHAAEPLHLHVRITTAAMIGMCACGGTPTTADSLVATDKQVVIGSMQHTASQVTSHILNVHAPSTVLNCRSATIHGEQFL